MHRIPELEDLRAFSALIGRDPLLTQGPSGNTSIKIDDCLWIKASGKWLANALQEEMFVPLSLLHARSLMGTQQPSTAIVNNPSEEELRPSIETAMHAVLPQRVVVHVHSVNTLARAVRSDAREHLESRLRDLRWEWIPYTLSGGPLAREIQNALGRSSVDVLILGNHGLVVCGNDCRSVASLLKQVEMRLGAIPRPIPQFDCNFLLGVVEGSNWRLPENARLHSLATDEASWNILLNGCLYACHALILGGPEAWRNGPSHRPFLILKNKGVLVSNEITRTELETLIGLAEVVQRIEPEAPIRYLTKTECEEIAALNPYCSERKIDHIPTSV